jgi:hypothetical protein
MFLWTLKFHASLTKEKYSVDKTSSGKFSDYFIK